jgi:hypothetical protein
MIGKSEYNIVFFKIFSYVINSESIALNFNMILPSLRHCNSVVRQVAERKCNWMSSSRRCLRPDAEFKPCNLQTHPKWANGYMHASTHARLFSLASMGSSAPLTNGTADCISVPLWCRLALQEVCSCHPGRSGNLSQCHGHGVCHLCVGRRHWRASERDSTEANREGGRWGAAVGRGPWGLGTVRSSAHRAGEAIQTVVSLDHDSSDLSDYFSRSIYQT